MLLVPAVTGTVTIRHTVICDRQFPLSRRDRSGYDASRCLIFDADGHIVSQAQQEHEQIFPRPGWVEHDAGEIWANVQNVTQSALDRAGLSGPTSPRSASPTSARRRCSGTRDG